MAWLKSLGPDDEDQEGPNGIWYSSYPGPNHSSGSEKLLERLSQTNHPWFDESGYLGQQDNAKKKKDVCYGIRNILVTEYKMIFSGPLQ